MNIKVAAFTVSEKSSNTDVRVCGILRGVLNCLQCLQNEPREITISQIRTEISIQN